LCGLRHGGYDSGTGLFSVSVPVPVPVPLPVPVLVPVPVPVLALGEVLALPVVLKIIPRAAYYMWIFSRIQ
jgi:hypothetical protein